MIHACEQFEKRYGEPLSYVQLKAIEELIRNNKCMVEMALMQGQEANQATMKIGDRKIRVVYDRHTFQIITFLPKDREKFTCRKGKHRKKYKTSRNVNKYKGSHRRH